MIYIEEAIQIATVICPLVIVDIVDIDTIRLDFQSRFGAIEFVDELNVRNGNKFRVARFDRQVVIQLL